MSVGQRRRFALRSLAGALVLCIACLPASGATLTVCSTGCDFVSIQAAVDAAVPGDTLELGAETFVETVSVAKDLTLRGAGTAATVVDGGAAGTVFTVDGAAVTLVEMTIRNGATAGDGGGIRSIGATARLWLDRCVVRDNLAGSRGGGLYNADGEVVITTDEITGNTAIEFGGGIYNENGSVTIRASAVHGNDATDFGGGISTYGNLTLEDSTVSGNSAQQAGGLDIVSLAVGREVSITRTTIAGNSASLGGGLFDYYGDGGPIRFLGSLVANNAGGNCGRSPTSSSPLVSAGYNLDSANSCGFGQPTDQTDTDPLLGPLADNGGPSPTHLPAANSAAVDAGPAWCAPADQRGEARPVDGDLDGSPRCDVGAAERSCDGGRYQADGRYGRLLFAPRCTEDAAGLPGAPGTPHVYDSVTLAVHRPARERLVVAAAPAFGFAALIGDDELRVNGVTVAGPYAPRPGRPPFQTGVPVRQNLAPAASVDITDLVPAGSSSVTFELVDTDRVILGNTAVYLAVDCGLTVQQAGGTELWFHSREDRQAGRRSGFKVVSGSLAELRASGSFALASCLGIYAENPGLDFFEDPPPGDGRYYVATGTTSCLAQGYGDSSLDPDPRDALESSGVCP